MNDTLTPEERAYHDALADAVDMGIHGEEALEYADRLRKTMWFDMRVLAHALEDAGVALRQTPPAQIASRLRDLLTRH